MLEIIDAVSEIARKAESMISRDGNAQTAVQSNWYM